MSPVMPRRTGEAQQDGSGRWRSASGSPHNIPRLSLENVEAPRPSPRSPTGPAPETPRIRGGGSSPGGRPDASPRASPRAGTPRDGRTFSARQRQEQSVAAHVERRRAQAGASDATPRASPSAGRGTRRRNPLLKNWPLPDASAPPHQRGPGPQMRQPLPSPRPPTSPSVDAVHENPTREPVPAPLRSQHAAAPARTRRAPYHPGENNASASSVGTSDFEAQISPVPAACMSALSVGIDVSSGSLAHSPPAERSVPAIPAIAPLTTPEAAHGSIGSPASGSCAHMRTPSFQRLADATNVTLDRSIGGVAMSRIEDHQIDTDSVTDSMNGRIDALNDITQNMIFDLSAYVTPPVPLPGGRASPRANAQLVAAPAGITSAMVVGRPPRPPGRENFAPPSTSPTSQGCSLVEEMAEPACQKDLDDLRFKVNYLELQVQEGARISGCNRSSAANSSEDVDQLRRAVLDIQEQLSDTKAQLSEARFDVRELKAQYCALKIRVNASCSQCTSVTAPPGASISVDRSRSVSAQHQQLPAMMPCTSPTPMQHGMMTTVCPSPPATTRYVHHGFTPPSQHQSVAQSLAASTGSLMAAATPTAPTQPLLAFATDKLMVQRPHGSSSTPCIAGHATPPPTARVLPVQYNPFAEVPALPTARGTYAIAGASHRPHLHSGSTPVKLQEVPRLTIPAAAG